MYRYIYIYTYLYTYIHIQYTSIQIHIYTYMHMSSRTLKHTHIHVYMSVCAYIYICHSCIHFVQMQTTFISSQEEAELSAEREISRLTHEVHIFFPQQTKKHKKNEKSLDTHTRCTYSFLNKQSLKSTQEMHIHF